MRDRVEGEREEEEEVVLFIPRIIFSSIFLSLSSDNCSTINVLYSKECIVKLI